MVGLAILIFGLVLLLSWPVALMTVFIQAISAGVRRPAAAEVG